MNLDILKESISNNNIDEAIKIVEEIGSNKETATTPVLLEYLQSTDNHILRNAIAIALSDIGCDNAVEPIINLLKHPKTKGSRGTLLYSLESLNYIPFIESLVDFLNDDSFEVSRQTLTLLESVNGDIPLEVIQKCIVKIENDVEKLEDKMDFLTDSLDVLNKLYKHQTKNKKRRR